MSGDEQFAGWERALADGSFEEAQQALEEVVARLESGNLSLDGSIASYALGMRLAARCEKMLAEAELVVSTLRADDPGEADDDEDDGSGDDRLDEMPC